MATYHCQIKVGNKGSGACASAKADYVCREGKYASKGDIEGTPWHGNMPTFAQDNPGEFWKASDSNERANGRVFTEIEIALPREDYYSTEDRRRMVEGFIAEQLPGHPFTVAIHCPLAAIEGGEQPHAHIIFSERIMDGIERDRDQFFKRAAAPYRDRVTKEMVKPDKEAEAKGGAKKDLSWHSRDKIIEVRKTWERHYNKGVFDVDQVSCKSLKAQGIDREPEQHLGPTLARTAAATHVIGRRKDVERLKLIGRELTAARNAAWKVEHERRSQYRSNRSAVQSAGRIAASLLPEPLGLTVQLASELLLLASSVNDWRHAQTYREKTRQIKTNLGKARQAIKEKTKPRPTPAPVIIAQVQLAEPIIVPQDQVSVTAIAPQLRQETLPVVSESHPAPSEALPPLTLNENTPPPSKPAVQSIAIAPAPAVTAAELAYNAALRRIFDISRTFMTLYNSLTAGTLMHGQEEYNDRTDRLESELDEITKSHPSIKISPYPYDDTPLIVNGEPITAIVDRLPPPPNRVKSQAQIKGKTI